jgi:hypothetical protein
MLSKLILAIIGLGLIGALTVARTNQQGRFATQTTCLQQMEMLWDTERSHVLEARLSVDTPVSQADLSQIMGGSLLTNMHCPLGPSEYAPFAFRNGPQCPYSEAHTEALKKTVADWPLYKLIIENEDQSHGRASGRFQQP